MNCKNQVATITTFVNGGYGLAHTTDGTPLFARYGLPGEQVSINVTEHRKRALFGHVSSVHTPHPDRIEPPCPFYGRCGGCNMQHVSYERQCGLKQQVVAELMRSSGRESVREAASSMQPTCPSPEQMHYRQRIRLAVDEKRKIGFKHFRSHSVVPVDGCLLAAPPINRCLREMLTNPNFLKLADISEQIELSYNPLDECVSALISLNRAPRPANRKHARELTRDIDELNRVFFYGRQFAQEGPFTADESPHQDRLIGFRLQGSRPLTLCWEAGGFSQVNLTQNNAMIKLVTALSGPGPNDHVLDLYCGMGNFALPLALQAEAVYGIESQGSAIRSARRNAVENGLDNCRFEKSDVASACRRLAEDNQRFDIVICDPPRRGLAELVPSLTGLTAGKLIYISCDPATLCRDLAALTEHGLAITSVQPVDMFPQTHHIETVVALQKRP